MTAAVLLPWLVTDWQKLAHRNLSGRLPHALLFTGKSGVGKSSFSLFTAQSFLCENPDKTGYCNNCNSCHLFAAGTHPDFLHVIPLEGKKQISIDQVRELIAEMELTPQCSARKVAVIDPADAMNTNSANALLKTLEEPASTHLLQLVCTTPGFLPPTIRSRCQTVELRVHNQTQVLPWLQQQMPDQAEELLQQMPDAPLGAIALADGAEKSFRQALLHDVLKVVSGEQSPTQAAQKYKDSETRDILALMLSWLLSGIKVRMDCADMSDPFTEIRQIELLVNKFDLNKLFNIYNKIQRFYAIDSSSFKTQAVLEGIFADMRLIHLN